MIGTAKIRPSRKGFLHWETSQKNRRRSDDHSDVGQYFSDPGLVQLIVDRYGDDLDLFYGDVELQDLSRGHLS